jgi:hypothetical protein
MTQQDLFESILTYNPNDGLFRIARIKRGTNFPIGTVVGYRDEKGYVKLTVNKKRYRAHRLAWLWMTGDSPSQIDHKNRVRHDNRFCNLRAADQTSNQRNVKKMVNNTSGVTGVYWRKDAGLWIAGIGISGKFVYLGRFKRKKDAINARLSAERQEGYDPTHGL